MRIAGRRTSMRLEQPYWEALAEIARREASDTDAICTTIAEKRKGWGLSSAVRIEVMLYFRERLAQLDAFAQAALAKQAAPVQPRGRAAEKPKPLPIGAETVAPTTAAIAPKKLP